MYKLLASFLDICPRQGLEAQTRLLVRILFPALLWPQSHLVRFDDYALGGVKQKVLYGLFTGS